MFILRFKAGQQGASSQNQLFSGSAIAWKLTTNAGVLTMRIVQESAGTYAFWGRMPAWRGGTLLLGTGYPFTYDGGFYGTSDPVVPAANVVNGQNAGGAFLDVTPNQIFTSAAPPAIITKATRPTKAHVFQGFCIMLVSLIEVYI
jgi:hypothetical protein